MATISKTGFIHFIQCPKLFWISTNAPTQIPWLPRQLDQLRQQEGREVESYAQRIFTDGAQINPDGSLQEKIADSKVAVSKPIFGKPIFNAIIQAQDLIAEIDILLPLDDGTFDLFEVKSSTDIKDHYLPQIAFQRHVCSQAGLKINHAYLLTINNKYVKNGKIEPKKLFNKNDVTDGIDNLAQELTHQISMAKEVIGSKKCPEIEIGAHCDNPFPCPMKEVCWEKINKFPNNIFTLTRMKANDKWTLFNQGIIKNADIPAKIKLMPRQKLQIQAEKTGQIYVSRKALKEFLDGIIYPVSFLDFETINPAIPMVNGTKPYQQIPFQFSLQILNAPNENPCDFDWIWECNNETSRSMLFQLKQFLHKTGSIVAYNTGFEKNVLKWMAKMSPEYGEWVDDVLERFVDLWEPFRNFVVYHPGQHGSCSLKAVLPAWTGQNYDHLQVQNGQMAGWTFRRILELQNDEEIEGLTNELERYCRLDTFGMVLILRKLKELSR